MKKIRAAVIGLGFIGACHVEAARRLGFAEVVAAADANRAYGEARAQELSIGRFYGSIEELLRAEDVDIIHNCTPNHMHWDVNRRIIEAQKIFAGDPHVSITEVCYKCGFNNIQHFYRVFKKITNSKPSILHPQK